MRCSINVDHIARIEGHGNIHLAIEDGAVATCEMNVVEPARLFESMVRGRMFSEIPYIASRICGICSASHVVTDLLAIERVFGIEVSDRTHALRELLIYGSYLQNHATHLFVFAAPDFTGHASVFPLATEAPELFNQALALKALGNELCTKVGGRSVHPITAVVGGFTNEISRWRRCCPSPSRRSTCSTASLFPISKRRATCSPWCRKDTTRCAPHETRGSWARGRPSTPTTTRLVSRNTPCRIPARSSRVLACPESRT